MERVCENCAREDDDMAMVNRVYVVPESWDTAASTTRMTDAELWCYSCRSIYPHEAVESAEG